MAQTDCPQSRFPGAYFDADKAAEAVNFIEALTLTKCTLSGDPEPFILLPHWRSPTEQIYGWRRPDGSRVVRKVFATCGRKQTKTQWAAGVATYEFFMGDQARQEAYFAAASADQAAICYSAVVDMIRADEELESVCKLTDSVRKGINLLNGNLLKVLSAEGKRQHGLNPSLVIFDELHAWGATEAELYAALTTGSKSRREPLWIAITTAGSDPESICGKEYEYACRVRDGKIDDPTYLPVIYEVPKEADWTDRSLWPKALPLLNSGHHKLEDYEEEFLQAQQRPEKQNEFRRLYLNQWTSTVTQWLQLHTWDACAGEPPTEEELQAADCWGGLDLGASNDLAAFALCWRLDGGRAFVRVWGYLPDADLAERCTRDGINYRHWVDTGALRATTNGVTVDFGQVFDHIEELHNRYRIQAVAYDRWRAKYIEKRAGEIGLTLLEWGQGFQSMTPAIEVFEDKVLNRTLSHEGNPAMRWNIDCCQLKTDGAGNKKLIKPPTYQKSKHIDLAIAGVMAVGASYLIEGHNDPYANGAEISAL